MPKQRKSATAERAKIDIANLKSIDPNLDLGDGLSIETLSLLVEEVRQAIEELNTADMVSARNRQLVQEKEKEINATTDRIRHAVAAKFGSKSTEYAAAIKASKRGKTSKSPEENSESNNRPNSTVLSALDSLS